LAHALEDAYRAESDKNSANCYYSEAVAKKMGSYQPNDYSKSESSNSYAQDDRQDRDSVSCSHSGFILPRKKKKGRPVRTALLGLRLRASW
jgi:hypothetical protein